MDGTTVNRQPTGRGGLIHHGDRGVPHVSIRHADRLAEAWIEPSVDSVGDSSRQRIGRDDPLSIGAEPRNSGTGPAGLGELAHPQATPASAGDIPPAEAEAVYYQQQTSSSGWRDSQQSIFGIPRGGSHVSVFAAE